jgi:hypothetical protein
MSPTKAAKPGSERSALYRDIQARDHARIMPESLEYDLEQIL